MIWATVAVVLGIALTVISADKFVEGAASLASRLGKEPFSDRAHHLLAHRHLSYWYPLSQPSMVAPGLRSGMHLAQTSPTSQWCLGSQPVSSRYWFQDS